jgi:D-glycero-D-manno-heptose 1,7-bisphosphate phosphatase
MLLAAAEEFDIDLTDSWLVGDSARDIDAGKTAGCTTILIENATHNRTLEPD